METRLHCFTPSALYDCLIKSRTTWKRVHPAAQAFLSPPKRRIKKVPSVGDRLEVWRLKRWKRFIKNRAGTKNEAAVAPNTLWSLQVEFNEKVFWPVRERATKIERRHDIVKASQQIRRNVKTQAHTAGKALENMGLWSPELDALRKREFYGKQIEAIKQKHGEWNNKLIESRAANIFYQIQSNPRYFRYLLNPDGTNPSLETIRDELLDARFMTLGQK